MSIDNLPGSAEDELITVICECNSPECLLKIQVRASTYLQKLREGNFAFIHMNCRYGPETDDIFIADYHTFKVYQQATP